MRPPNPTSAIILTITLASACAATSPPQLSPNRPPSEKGAPTASSPSPEVAAQSESRTDVTDTSPATSPQASSATLSTDSGQLLCGVKPEGPNVVILGCQGLTIRVMREQSVTRAMLIKHVLVQQGWSRTMVRVGDSEVDGAVFRGEAAGAPRTGIAVAAGQYEGTPTLLTCVGPAGAETEQRCRQVLPGLALHGLPESVRFEDVSLSLGGRALNVPRGCKLIPTNDRILCPGAELHWRDPVPTCAGTQAERRTSFENLLRAMGEIEYASVTCTVLGREADCHRWLLRIQGRPPGTLLASGIGCGVPMAQCNFYNTTPERMPTQYPPPCDQVFTGVPPR